MVGGRANHREHVFPANHANDFGFDSNLHGKGLEDFEQRKGVPLHVKKITLCDQDCGSKERQRN